MNKMIQKMEESKNKGTGGELVCDWLNKNILASDWVIRRTPSPPPQSPLLIKIPSPSFSPEVLLESIPLSSGGL